MCEIDVSLILFFPRTAPGDKIEVTGTPLKARVGEECHFKLDVLDKDIK